MFFAIIAASIHIVPDQHIGSSRGVLKCRPHILIKLAAKFSFNGASPVSFLYHLLCKDSQLVLTKILHLSFII